MTPEEALIHAYEADIARLPQEQQLRFNAQRMAADHMAGKTTPELKRFRHNVTVGHPSYDPKTEGERALQEHMLSGYTGQPWTPDQHRALGGRDPNSYEFSPGAKFLADAESRARLHDDIARARGAVAAPPSRGMSSPGGFIPQFSQYQSSDEDVRNAALAQAAQHYDNAIVRKNSSMNPLRGSPIQSYDPRPYRHTDPETGELGEETGQPAGFIEGLDLNREMQNPENPIGSLTTKASGAVSDTLSLLGTALLRKTDATNVLGDAATRVAGSDFNRNSPVLAKDNGWRANDALLQQGRAAHKGSEGMSAGDTFRGAIGNHILPESWNGQIPYVQPLINAGISFANGMGDGIGAIGATRAVPNMVRSAARGVARTGVPLATSFAKSTADDITRHLATHPTYGGRMRAYNYDELVDISNGVELFGELATRDTRSNSQWDMHQKYEEDQRQKSIKTLEGLNDQIVRPKSTVTNVGKAIAPYAAPPLMHTGNALSKAGNWLGGLLSK